MDRNKATGLAQAPTEQRTAVDTGRVTEHPDRPRELQRLDVFIGRWMTEGETVAEPDSPAVPIVASDVYQWLPGGHFVMHPAYGCIGTVGVGGLEIIGYDHATREYQCEFFDSQGNETPQTLSNSDNVWTWQGTRARCTGVFTPDGKTMTARHERSDDGSHWVPSMNVVLGKVE
jgi:hypothetical protein